MSNLALTSLILGATLLATGILFFIKRESIIYFFSGLPRNIWLGRVLTAIVLVWSAFLVYKERFGLVDRNIWLLFVSTPILFWLIIKYMDELLCARAIGGLFAIIPAVMLDTAFVENSTTRLFVTCFAYMMAIVGMILIWSPYLMRKALAPCFKTQTSTRVCGTLLCVFGLFYAILAFTAYR